MIGKIGVSVQSDVAEALDDFARLYPETSSVGSACGPSIDMSVDSSRRTVFRRETYSIRGDGNDLFRDRLRGEVLPYLEWGINHRVVETRGGLLQVHAASLTYKGCGFVFPAQSGSGKSTLAAALMSRGWAYATDELAMVDPETLEVHPFPKALCIKSGSFDILQRLGLRIRKQSHYVSALKGRVGYVVPQDVRADVLSAPSPIDFVIFPKYVEGAEPRLLPLPRSRVVVMLASSTLNRNVFGDRAMSIVSGIVRGARCMRLESGDLSATSRLLEDLVDGQRACVSR